MKKRVVSILLIAILAVSLAVPAMAEYRYNRVYDNASTLLVRAGMLETWPEKPDAAMTRAESLSLAMNLFRDGGELFSLTDADALTVLGVETGFIEGNGNNDYYLSTTATRAEFAAMFLRASGRTITGSDWKDQLAVLAESSRIVSDLLGEDMEEPITKLDALIASARMLFSKNLNTGETLIEEVYGFAECSDGSFYRNGRSITCPQGLIPKA